MPLLIIAISAMTALAISAAIAFSAREWLTKDLQSHAAAVAQSMARSLTIHMSRDDVWEAFEAVRAVALVEGGSTRCEVVVLDATGRIFVSSDPARYGVRRQLDVLSAPLAQAWQLAVVADKPAVRSVDATGGRYSVVKTQLLSTDGEATGTLLMSYSHAVFAQRYRETLITLATITAGLALVLLPVGWWLGQRLANPVTRVTDALYALGEEASGKALIGALAASRESGDGAAGSSEIERLEHALARLHVQLHEKEQLQRQFIAADRLAAIGRMTSSVAHEINNPLAGMMNALSNLRLDPAQLPKTLALIERGLEQIRQTLSALLIETKTQTRPLLPDDIDDLKILVLPQSQRKHLQLTWRYPFSGELAVSAAPVRQVILNLLLNAIQAAEREVGFEAGLEGETLRFTVTNDGQSFPAARHDQPFAPFVAAEGHGLGLWASHLLVSSLGGLIEVASEGGLTRFQVRVPVSPPLLASTAGSSTSEEVQIAK